ncbi:MAG: PAS domain S-box protein, partial [Candidatus Binatia bacterium]
MKNPIRQSLRNQLVALVLVAVLPAFGLIIYSAINDHRKAVAEVKDSASRIVRLAARSHEQLIDEAYNLLSLLTRLPWLLLDAPGCETLLKDLLTRHPSFANMVVVSPAGVVTCSARPQYIRINYSDRPWFKDATSQQKFVTSEYLLGRVTTDPIVVFAAPVLDAKGTVQAVLGVSLRLEWIDRLTEQARLPAGSTFTLVDWQGTVLARHPRAERHKDKSHPDAKLIRLMLAQTRETTIERADPDGINRLYITKPLDEHSSARPWYLAIGIPKATAYAQARAILSKNLIFMGIVAALALAVAWWGGTTLIFWPIRSLVDSTAKLGKGDLSVRTGVNDRQDEIGQLAGAFDQMAQALELRETDRQRAAEMDARLVAIVESSNDAIVGHTLDGMVTSWNKGAERLFGYSSDEMVGHSISLLIPQDQLDSFAFNLERVKRGERIDSYEITRLKKGKELVAVSVTVSPTFDENGAVVGASSITRDISQRKRSEAEIKALHSINVEITSTLNLQMLLQILLEKIHLLLPYTAAHIRLINKQNGQLERVVHPNEKRWKPGDDRVPHPIVDTILSTRRSLAISDLQADRQNPPREFYREHGLVSYLGVPLIVKDEAIGVLSLFTENLHKFTEAEVRFAETLAKQASLSIANSQLYEETKRLSDELILSETESRRLANGLIRARDEEAKHIAHTLHD